MFMKLPIIP